MMTHRRSSQGFTLIELMITLAIAAILMVVAVPNFTAYKRNAELTSAANTLLAAINAARGEAMKRSMYAMVVPTDAATWNNGLVVFTDKDRSQTYSSNTDQTVLTQAAPPSYLTISGNGTAGLGTPYILFDGSGYPKTKAGGFGALTLTITRTDLSGTTLAEQTRRLIISTSGRVRVCKPSTDTTCLSSATQ